MGILRPGETERHEIALETRAGTQIKNSQLFEVSRFVHVQVADLEKKWGIVNTLRPGTKLDPIYNCHGLTFASRRTGIDDLPWTTILEEDGYNQIPVERTLPGDIIIYFDGTGSAAHSGIVLEHTEADYSSPLILSKWGSYGEVIHFAHNVPSEYGIDRRYYRVVYEY